MDLICRIRILPLYSPHFASDTTHLSQATLKEILPGFEDFLAYLKAVVPYFLASILLYRHRVVDF